LSLTCLVKLCFSLWLCFNWLLSFNIYPVFVLAKIISDLPQLAGRSFVGICPTRGSPAFYWCRFRRRRPRVLLLVAIQDGHAHWHHNQVLLISLSPTPVVQYGCYTWWSAVWDHAVLVRKNPSMNHKLFDNS
jgi:hypothetical protein